MTDLKSKKNISNEDLVCKFSESRDIDLFEEIYDRFAKKVYNSCFYFLKNVQDAEDASQELFLNLFINIKKFSGKSKFSTWLNAFVYNHCVNILVRDKPKNLLIHSVEINEDLIGEDTVDDAQIFDLKYELLNKALDKMEADQKAILLLKYKDEISLKDLADYLEIGESAVKMRLSRAKKNLITLYKKVENGYQ
ncbi:MAG: RNA polymerase sigma factor [Flavobacterium sp.]